MRQLLDFIISIVFILTVSFGVETTHEVAKKAIQERVSKGLSSTTKFTEKLIGNQF